MKLFLFACLAFANGLGILNSQPAFAAAPRTVTLLISLDPALNPTGLFSIFNDYAKEPQELAVLFQQALKNSGYNLQVIQNATVDDLYQAMHSPDELAIFWVSHVDPISWSNHSGMTIDPILADAHLADVKDALLEINPSIQWVSLVACDSQDVVQWVQSQATANKNVHWQGFNKEIFPQEGLRQSLKEGMKALAAAPPEASAPKQAQPCATEAGIPIQVTRTLAPQGQATGARGFFFPAITIQYAGTVIGTLPEADVSSGQTQTQVAKLFLPISAADALSSLQPSDLQIDIDSGIDPLNQPEGFMMGDFQISEDSNSWKVFSASDGSPFGVTAQTFLYQGANPSTLPVQSFQPFSCNGAD